MKYIVTAQNGQSILHFGPFNNATEATEWAAATWYSYHITQLRAPVDIGHHLP